MPLDDKLDWLRRMEFDRLNQTNKIALRLGSLTQRLGLTEAEIGKLVERVAALETAQPIPQE